MDLFRVLVDVIQYIWPFRIVWQWQIAGYYWFGRYCGTVGPGCYPIVPFFSDVRDQSISWAIVSTGRKDITLADGSLLTWEVSGTVRLVDYDKAVHEVHEYRETTVEAMRAVIAERLVDVKPERLEPASRKRLMSDLTRWVNEETNECGVEVSKLRFTTFVLNPRPFRLLQDVTDNTESW